jgi:hypothetical protein
MLEFKASFLVKFKLLSLKCKLFAVFWLLNEFLIFQILAALSY